MPGPGRDQVEVQRLLAAFQALVRRSAPGLAGALLVVSAAVALLQVPSWALGLLLAVSPTIAPPAFAGFAQFCFFCATVVALPFVLTVTTGLYRVARRLLLEPGAEARDTTAVLRHATADYFATFLGVLVCFLAVAVGLALCILPGFVAFVFLVFLPYLVATQGLEVGTAVTRSVEIAQKHAVPLVVTLVVAVVAAGGALAVATVAMLVLQPFVGPLWAAAALAPFQFLLFAAVGLVVWLWVAAALVTIDAAESGLPLALDG